MRTLGTLMALPFKLMYGAGKALFWVIASAIRILINMVVIAALFLFGNVFAWAGYGIYLLFRSKKHTKEENERRREKREEKRWRTLYKKMS
jgi:hypothetical protein